MRLLGWTCASASFDLLMDQKAEDTMDDILYFPNVVFASPERCMAMAAAEERGMWDEEPEAMPMPTWTQEGEVDEPPSFRWDTGAAVYRISPVFME